MQFISAHRESIRLKLRTDAITNHHSLIMDREKIIEFYSHDIEKNRLETEEFKLEGLRTREIISRYLSGDKMGILDIGGGAGFYSFWLQAQGHEVSLVDLSPVNIGLAQSYSKSSGVILKKMEVADAIRLPFPDHAFDLVLLLGPLYHLIDRSERVKALMEALRVLKPGGTVIAAVISRYASMIDGFLQDLVLDDRFFEMLKSDLRTGIHLNETDNLQYFTTAYLHTPEDIKSEINESGLSLEKLVAVESFGWAVKNFHLKEKDPGYMAKLFEIIRSVESDDNLIAMSPHILAIAKGKG